MAMKISESTFPHTPPFFFLPDTKIKEKTGKVFQDTIKWRVIMVFLDLLWWKCYITRNYSEKDRDTWAGRAGDKTGDK